MSGWAGFDRSTSAPYPYGVVAALSPDQQLPPHTASRHFLRSFSLLHRLKLHTLKISLLAFPVHFLRMFRLPGLIALLFCASAFAENSRVLLNVGDIAPEFHGVDDQGKSWHSSDYVGKRVLVVYFYPADMSGICTKQAQVFQERLRELKEAGITVVGVSGDSVKNHQLFRKTNSLDFRLLSDEDGKIAAAFGVPVRKGGQISKIIDGQQRLLVRGVTAQRWTFVVGLNGEILHKNTDVNPTADCGSVLKVVRQLTASAQ